MTKIETEIIQAPVEGLNTEEAPDMLPEGAATDHVNLLTHYERLVKQRGPFPEHDDLLLGSNEIITGVWTFGNKALVGLASTSASAQIEAHTAPYRKAAAAASLAEPKTTMILIDFDAMTTTNVAAAQGTVIHGSGTRIGAYVYGFAYSGTTDDLAHGGYVHRRSLLRWDGSSSAPTAVTNAPDSGFDVKAHYDALFVLGGRDVPSAMTAHEWNTLYYSQPGGPVNLLASDWQDPEDGSAQKIVVDVNDPDDFGVGLAKVGDNLCILKRYSIHMLYGDSPANFSVRTVDQHLGCVDSRTIVEVDGGVYFLSQEGLMFFDGASFTEISANVHSELTALTYNTVGDGGFDGGRAVMEMLPGRYLLLSIGGQDFTNGARSGTQRAYLIYAPQQRWTRFESAALAGTTPLMVGAAAQRTFAMDSARALVADNIGVPESVDAAERGFDHTESTDAAIRSYHQSRLTQFANATHCAKLHRVLFDYTYETTGSDEGDLGAWQLSVVEGTGRSLVTSTTTPIMGSTTSYLYRRRYTEHLKSKAEVISDCVVRHETMASPPSPVADASLYDTVLEYEVTRPRETT